MKSHKTYGRSVHPSGSIFDRGSEGSAVSLPVFTQKLKAHTVLIPHTSREMRRDNSAVSGTRNKANRGNREVTYNAYDAFSALFFEIPSDYKIIQRGAQ